MSFASSVKNPSIETLLKTDKVRAGGVLARASPPPRPTEAASTDVADRKVLRCMAFSEAGESELDSPAIRMRTPGFDSLLFAHLAQQTQDFQV
jgi:hypothetical protein